jgi:hypothetical protein
MCGRSKTVIEPTAPARHWVDRQAPWTSTTAGDPEIPGQRPRRVAQPCGEDSARSISWSLNSRGSPFTTPRGVWFPDTTKHARLVCRSRPSDPGPAPWSFDLFVRLKPRAPLIVKVSSRLRLAPARIGTATAAASASGARPIETRGCRAQGRMSDRPHPCAVRLHMSQPPRRFHRLTAPNTTARHRGFLYGGRGAPS